MFRHSVPSSGCAYEATFYNSLNELNRRLRPKTRKYYDKDDPHVPKAVRAHVDKAFKDAMTLFPLKFGNVVPYYQFASPETEDGMPHTLGKRIIIPLSDGLANDSRLTSTLIHELCHVHQRFNPASWAKLYGMLGFKRYHGKLPDEPREVANPDTGIGMPELGNWTMNGQIVRLVFNDDATRLRDHYVSTMFVPMPAPTVTANWHKQEETFKKYASQVDHPNEITACIIADHYDVVMKGNAKEDDPRMIIHTWILDETSSH